MGEKANYCYFYSIQVWTQQKKLYKTVSDIIEFREPVAYSEALDRVKEIGEDIVKKGIPVYFSSYSDETYLIDAVYSIVDFNYLGREI